MSSRNWRQAYSRPSWVTMKSSSNTQWVAGRDGAVAARDPGGLRQLTYVPEAPAAVRRVGPVARREIGGTAHQGKSTRVRLAQESFNAFGVRKDVRDLGQSDEGRVGRDQCVCLCVQGCRREDGVEGADFLN